MTAIPALSLAFILTLISFSNVALSARPKEWVFGSSFDYFKVTRTGNKFFIGSESVSFVPFKEFAELFNSEFDGDCPDFGRKPDLTVRAVISEGNSVKRNFYIKEKTVSDGKTCVEIEGTGIYYVPLHRSWFKGQDSSVIQTGNSLKIFKEKELLLQFRKNGEVWRNTTPNFFVNWQLFDNVLKTFEKFSISARLHPSAAEGAPSFRLESGRFSYNFYLIGNGLWAVKKPKVKWLLASNDWALLDDMRLSLWKDVRFDDLLKIADKNADPDDRISAIYKLKNAWSRAIKYTYQRIMEDPSDVDKVKGEIARKLENHPSDDVFASLVVALTKTNSVELQNHITKILRVRNPKGPVIKDLEIEQRDQHIKSWQKWAKSLKPNK